MRGWNATETARSVRELPSSFAEVLRDRAESEPDKVAFTFLADGRSEEETRTYGQLDREARAIAAALDRERLTGQNAVLLYGPGLEFVSALVGCFYAGVVAVPSHLPRPNRPSPRLEAIVTDARPGAVLTTADLLQRRGSSQLPGGALESARWIATDEVDTALADAWVSGPAGQDTLACLQYTSGSTAQPKGVMLTHGNLLANSAMIAERFEHPPHRVGLSWLPHYHDMGLIGGILQPLFVEMPGILMSPALVVQDPMRWLRAISRYRATTTGGPNFIYDRCVRALRREPCPDLDLSLWEVAYNGAEPIRAETLREFSAALEPYGFRPEAMFPCYGLAEATLMVSGGPRNGRPLVRTVSKLVLEDRNEVAEPAGNGDAQPIVACGSRVPGSDVRIVDPKSGLRLPPGQIGEIWVGGASVAQGYWNRPEENAATFGAAVEGANGSRFLRTGDLGFLSDGQLFITGRLKDLIIIDGRNHYPHDFELTVEKCHPGVRPHGGAAFSVECRGERLVIAHELERNGRRLDVDEIHEAIREAVARDHDVTVDAIALLKTGALPRTTSGKVQRRLCRKRFLGGELNVVDLWLSDDLARFRSTGANGASAGRARTRKTRPSNGKKRSANGRGPAPSNGNANGNGRARSNGRAAKLRPSSPMTTPDHESVKPASVEAIQRWLVARIAAKLECPPDEVDLARPFAAYGLSSRDAVEMSGDLERLLQRRLTPTLVYDYPNIERLSRHLAGEPTPEGAVGTDGPEPSRRVEPVAIVGLACRLPGAPDADAFWQLLVERRDAIREVPPDRWDADAVDRAIGPVGVDGRPGTVRWGGFLEGIDRFDFGFFGLSPREAAAIDPQHRLLMEVAWEALEDADQAVDRLRGSRTGVFVGIATSDYVQQQLRRADGPDPLWTVGGASSMAAGRLSYAFDFQGPSMAVDTACSSSLVAVELAAKSLRGGDCDLAVACGVNVILSPEISVSFARGGGLSPDGRCKAFSADANGIVRSEGAGAVVLKPLARALADGDPIYAVIRGGAVNQDGRSSGITAPNQGAQEAVLSDACRNAGVSPQDIQYVETHGAGTVLGDLMEVNALKAVLGNGRKADAPCSLGSVKTNIGHCEAAAGIAGLVKVALAMRHRRLPPNLHFDRPNPHLELDGTPFRVQERLEPWPGEDGRLLAGVSSFGFGGTNAHLVLESVSQQLAMADESTAEEGQVEPEKPIETGASPTGGTHLLPLSAAGPAALADAAARFDSLLGEYPDGSQIALADLCHAAAVRRSHHDCRAAVRFRTRAGLREKLALLRAGGPQPGVAVGSVLKGRTPKLAFVFSGHGGHDAAMGRRLFDRVPVFRQRIEDCDEILRELADWSLRAVFTGDEADSPLATGGLEVVQTSVFALQVALADAWKTWGVEPDGVVGHSMGEVAAACTAGALELPDAMRVIVLRSRLLEKALRTSTDDCGMAAVRVSPDGIADVVRGYEDRVAVSVHNSPRYTVLSGETAALDEIIQQLRKRKIGGRLLNVPGAGHTPALEPVRKRLAETLAGLRAGPGETPFYSTVMPGVVEGGKLDAAYWGLGLREPVRFAGAVDRLLDDGFRFFVELGPHALLTAALTQCAAPRECEVVAVPSLRRNEDDSAVMIASLGSLYVRGWPVDWRKLYPTRRRRVRLPRYPWQRERCWIDTGPTSGRAAALRPPSVPPGDQAGSHPLLGYGFELASQPGTHCWNTAVSTRRLPWLADHQLQGRAVLPVAAYLEAALAAAGEALGDRPCVLEDVELHRALFVPQDDAAELQVTVECETANAGRFQLFTRQRSRHTPCAVRQPAAVGSGPGGSSDIGRDEGLPDGTRSVPATMPWVLHATCSIRPEEPTETATPQPPRSLDAARSACGDELDVAAHYQRLADLGAHVGPSFQGLRQAWGGDGEARGRVELPDVLAHEAGGYRVHPALIDAALQVLAVAISSGEAQGHYVPVGLRRFRLAGPVPAGGRLWSHAVVRPPQGDGPEAIEGDVFVWDEAGRPVMELEGLRLRPLDVAAPITKEEPDRWLYELRWLPDEEGHPSKPPSREDAPAEPGSWLLLSDASSAADSLKQSLEARGQRCVLVAPGQGLSTPEDGPWTVDPTSPEDFRQVIQRFDAIAGPPLAGVIHWIAPAEGPAETTFAGLLAAEDRLYVSLLRTVQAMADREGSLPPRLAIVTQGAASVAGGPSWVSLAQAPLWAMGRVVQREHPDLHTRLIDLDPQDGEGALERLAHDLLANETPDQFAYRGATRYVPRLARYEMPLPPAGDAEIRPDATYLIAGGLGGLGRTVARWMVDRGARHLVLVSRRGETPEAEAWLGELRASGAQVTVAKADLGEPGEVADVVRRIEESMPPLCGVIHSASTLDDAFVARMEPSQLIRVLRPKTLGAWNLHEATLESPLDFFVCFSSAASLLGPPGGANYAAANAFLDALAEHRRSQGKPALSIRWGPWAGVGIAVHSDYERRVRLPGLDRIEADRGLEVFARLLARDETGLAVMPVDWNRLRRAYPQLAASPMLEDVLDRNGDARTDDGLRALRAALGRAEPSQRRSLVEEYLREQVARALGLTPKKVRPDEPLVDLGMDSLLAIELKNRVEAELGATIPVVELLEQPTVSRLAGLLSEGLPGRLPSHRTPLQARQTLARPSLPSRGPAQGKQADRLLREVDGLSDDQVNSLLQDMLAEGDGPA